MGSSTTQRRLGLVGDKGMKAPVDLATTANITLSGEQVIDGVTTDESRVLVWMQTNQIENGYYDTNTGDWTRCIDANSNLDLVKGTLVAVTGGTQAGGYFHVTSANPVQPGSTAITFEQDLTNTSNVLRSQLANSSNLLFGPGLIGYNVALAYASGTVGDALNDLSADVVAAALAASNAATAAGAAQTTANAAAITAAANFPRDQIAGLTLSPTGASASMPVAAGAAADGTNAVVMLLAASLNKTTAAWVAGTNVGGLDTGAIANSTLYYFWLIRNPTSTVVDVLFSTNSTTPTMPAGYTQKRYIGSGITTAGGNWLKIVQDGDDFYFDTPVLNVSTVTSGTVAVTSALSVPSRRVKAYLSVVAQNQVYISDLSVSDMAPSATVSPLVSVASGGGGGTCAVWMSSGSVRSRCSVNGTLYITVLGWMDRRGRA